MWLIRDRRGLLQGGGVDYGGVCDWLIVGSYVLSCVSAHKLTCH